MILHTWEKFACTLTEHGNMMRKDVYSFFSEERAEYVPGLELGSFSPFPGLKKWSRAFPCALSASIRWSSVANGPALNCPLSSQCLLLKRYAWNPHLTEVLKWFVFQATTLVESCLEQTTAALCGQRAKGLRALGIGPQPHPVMPLLTKHGSEVGLGNLTILPVQCQQSWLTMPICCYI